MERKKTMGGCVWMMKNRAEWASGHGQLTNIRLSDGCGGKPFQRRSNLGTIAMDLKPIWEMSVNNVIADRCRRPGHPGS